MAAESLLLSRLNGIITAIDRLRLCVAAGQNTVWDAVIGAGIIVLLGGVCCGSLSYVAYLRGKRVGAAEAGRVLNDIMKEATPKQ